MRRFVILLSMGLSLWHWNACASFDSDADTSIMEGLGWRMDIFSDHQAGALIYWAQLLSQPDGKVVVVDTSAGLAVNVGRLNNDGTLDTTFGNQGWTTEAFNWMPTLLETLLQTDGKIVVAASFDNQTITLMRFLANGQMDNSFAGNGRLNLAYPYLTSLSQQSTGKLIVGTNMGLLRLNADGSLDTTFNIAQQPLLGHSHVVHSDDSIFIYNASNRTARHFSADGVLDTSFGSGGVVTLLTSGITSSSMAIVNNKLWVGGFYFSAGNFPGVACRLNLNGTLDTSFDGDGCLTFNGNWTVPSIYTLVAGMEINSSQQVLFWYQNGSSVYQAARFNANGTLDTSFSGDGYYDPVNTPISDMALQGSKILLAGHDQSVPQGVIRGLDSAGTLDATFAGDGEYNDFIRSGSTIYLDSIRLSDGKLLAAGVNGNHRLAYSIPPRIYWPGISSMDLHDPSQCVVARYDSNGEPDLAFNATGHALFNPNQYCSLTAVRELHNGNYLVAGSSRASWSSGGGYRALLMQINSSGKLDGNFDSDGIVEVAADLVYYRMEQQSNDKILVMGIDDSSNGVVIRYHTDGTVDTSYATSGRLTLTGSKRFSSALQADDKLLLYLLDGKLKRFNTDGSLDESFGNKGEVLVNGINNMADFAYGNFLVLKNNGKILLVESTGDSQFRLRQFNDNGIADNSFGTAGMVDLPSISALVNPPLRTPTDFRMVSLAQDQQDNTIVLGHAGLDSGDYNNYLTQIILLRYSASGQLDEHLFAASNGVAQPVLANTWIYPTDVHPDLDKGLWLTGSVANRGGGGSGVGAGLLFKMKGVADYDNDSIANDMDTDVEGDQLPDAWEQNYFGDLWLWNASSNTDGDAWNMLKEFQMNTHPGNADTDGDGINDDTDYNPLNAVLQSGNETLPLDSTYKGSTLKADQTS